MARLIKLAGATAVCCVAGACATSPTSRPETRMLTGSYIAQPVRQTGLITDGASPVIVLDRKAIAASGAVTLSQVLRTVPFLKVTGP